MAIKFLIALAAVIVAVSAFSWPIKPLTPSINLDTDVIEHSGDYLGINWQNVDDPQANDFLAIYSPASAEDKDYLGTILLSTSSTWASGKGRISIPFVNMRTTFQVRLWTANPANDTTKIVSARSDNITFRNPSMPSQIHIALADDESQMRVMWVSSNPSEAYVQYGSQASYGSTVVATSTSYSINDLCAAPGNLSVNFIDPGTIFDAVLTGLSPDTVYFYRVGSDITGWSKMHQFRSAPKVGPTFGIDVVAFGDLGTKLPFNIVANGGEQQVQSAETVDNIARNIPQLTLHIGDISYARGYSYLWEYWFHQIQPVASEAPYMVSIGNHEYDYQDQPFKPNWSDYGRDSGGECGVPYQHRFHMPGPAESRNLWYSFNLGNAHFVVMSSEHDFTEGSPQWQWIQKDLSNVDRSVTPWVIFGGHRPAYDTTDYGFQSEVVDEMRQNIEPLLVKYRVNLALWGHVHVYERTCGINNYVCAEDDSDAPVHVIIGMAGHNYQNPWWSPSNDINHTVEPDWLVFRTMNFGYTRIQTNATHLHFQYLGNGRNLVHDEFYLHL